MDIYNRELLYEEYIIKRKSIRQISEEFNCNINNLGYYIKKYQFKKDCDFEIVNNKYGKIICEEYMQGISMSELSMKYANNNQYSIEKVLAMNGVYKRNKQEARQIYEHINKNKIGTNGRKYTLNYDYFKTWSHDMAYILGFIASDGYVRNDGVLKISLKRSDKKLLEDIKEKLEYTGEIIDEVAKIKSKSYNTSTLKIHCKSLVEDLIKHGIIQNKSLKVRLPIMPEEFKIDFIRGYFDGDGSIGEIKLAKTTKTQIRFRICSGSYDMLNDIVEYFYSLQIGKVKISKSKNKTLYNILYSTLSSIKIHELFYNQENCLYLERKKLKFDELIHMRE